MTNESQQGLCPLLGLVADRSVMLSGVSDHHRCYANSLPRKPTVYEQETYCLTAQHGVCPYYNADAALAASSDMEVTPTPAHGWTRARLLLWGVAVLFSGAILAGLVLFSTGEFDQAAALESATPMSGGADVPTASPAPPTPFPVTVDAAAQDVPATSGQAVALILVPTPTPAVAASGEGKTLTLSPDGGEVGWWRNNDPRRNYIGDSFLYAGQRDGDTYIAAMRFDLRDVPRGAPITDVTLSLTGLRRDQIVTDGSNTWLLQLVPESSLEQLPDADFLTLYSAPASIVLYPQLRASDLDEGRTNTWTLDANARAWLQQEVFNGATSVYVRLQASPNGSGDSLFAWDSGFGSASQGNGPVLTLVHGAPPPTPPPLPTVPVIVATLTKVPENVLTVVAEAATATTAAELVGTNTPLPYAVVTPTPLPQNLATVQAGVLGQELPAVVLDTPTPANVAEATANALYATAVAQTTGTFTPVPTGYVTPVLVRPSPPAQNVATEAARVAEATQTALNGGPTATPLPFNAVLAQYVYATELPGNVVTAAAVAVNATAQAEVNGTPTPLPWNAVIITAVPTPLPPTATPLPLFLEPTATSIPNTATPLPVGLPPDVAGKIIFLSDRTGVEMPHLLDPATGEVQLITQRWVYDRAREALGGSPDGSATALVEEDITRPKADGGHVLQIKVHSNQYGDTRQVTACSSDCYDPAWSPDGMWIAYVGKDLLDEEIYRVNLDGSVVTQLTFNDWESDKHPSWSPDGSRIVFFSNRTGKNQIWIMNADGSGQQNLSNNEYNDWNPIWIRP
ncbi:MAG: PD40 domain-containing protein [Caldilineaceae bacterium]|nr:PD40 domain-containing protein [Caldilineaceae bacterium]